jgi:hypothetical protein
MRTATQGHRQEGDERKAFERLPVRQARQDDQQKMRI